MSYELVVNTLWHAPPDIRGPELAVLLAIAEITRTPGHPCTCEMKELVQCARVSADAVQKALRRLAAKSVDVRVPVGAGVDGRPVYAHNGRASRYRLPWFTATPDCLCGTCRAARQAVDNSTKDGTTSALPSSEGRNGVRPSEGKGGRASAEGRKSVRGRADVHPPHPVAGKPVAAAAPAPAGNEDPNASAVAARLGIDYTSASRIVAEVERQRAPVRNLPGLLRSIPDAELLGFLPNDDAAAVNGGPILDLPPVCGECDALDGEGVHARIVWLDADRSSSTPCPRCNPKAVVHTGQEARP